MSDADPAADQPASPREDSGVSEDHPGVADEPAQDAALEELGGEPPCQLPRFWDPDEEPQRPE